MVLVLADLYFTGAMRLGSCMHADTHARMASGTAIHCLGRSNYWLLAFATVNASANTMNGDS